VLFRSFGVSEPISARLFADQKHLSPATLSQNDYRSLLIEPEILAILGADIEPRDVGHDRDSVVDAIEKFVPAMELIDSRGISIPDVLLASAIAQNVSCEGLVMGGPGLPPRDLTIETLKTTVTFDGEMIAELAGKAPQHPLDVVAWMANHLASRGQQLKAGMVILCGTHMPPKPLGTAKSVNVEMVGLGSVEFNIS